MKVASSFPVICSCNLFFHKIGFKVKCSINIYYFSKSGHCYLPPPSHLVYGFYVCENINNCEGLLTHREKNPHKRKFYALHYEQKLKCRSTTLRCNLKILADIHDFGLPTIFIEGMVIRLNL